MHCVGTRDQLGLQPVQSHCLGAAHLRRAPGAAAEDSCSLAQQRGLRCTKLYIDVVLEILLAPNKSRKVGCTRDSITHAAVPQASLAAGPVFYTEHKCGHICGCLGPFRNSTDSSTKRAQHRREALPSALRLRVLNVTSDLASSALPSRNQDGRASCCRCAWSAGPTGACDRCGDSWSRVADGNVPARNSADWSSCIERLLWQQRPPTTTGLPPRHSPTFFHSTGDLLASPAQPPCARPGHWPPAAHAAAPPPQLRWCGARPSRQQSPPPRRLGGAPC